MKKNITKTKKIFLAGCLFFASTLAVISIVSSKAEAAMMDMPGMNMNTYGMNMSGMDMSGMFNMNMGGMNNMNGMAAYGTNYPTNWNQMISTPTAGINGMIRTNVAPNNASWNQMTGGWQCNYGYTPNRITGTCEPIAVPENASLNTYGTGWQCNDRHILNSQTNSCDPVPAYATANQAKTGWFCNWGYKQKSDGTGCNPISIPENAVLDYWGTSWQCKSGYAYSYLTGMCEENPLYHY